MCRYWPNRNARVCEVTAPGETWCVDNYVELQLVFGVDDFPSAHERNGLTVSVRPCARLRRECLARAIANAAPTNLACLAERWNRTSVGIATDGVATPVEPQSRRASAPRHRPRAPTSSPLVDLDAVHDRRPSQSLADMLPDDPTLLVAVSESSAVIAPDRDERRSPRDLAPSERIVATLAAAPGAPSSR